MTIGLWTVPSMWRGTILLQQTVTDAFVVIWEQNETATATFQRNVVRRGGPGNTLTASGREVVMMVAASPPGGTCGCRKKREFHWVETMKGMPLSGQVACSFCSFTTCRSADWRLAGVPQRQSNFIQKPTEWMKFFFKHTKDYCQIGQ